MEYKETKTNAKMLYLVEQKILKMKFLQSLLASVMGFFIAMALIFVFFIVIAISFASMEDEPVTLTRGTVLELSFDSELLDYYPSDDSSLFQALDLENPYIGLNDIIQGIKVAKNDNNIKAISIQFNDIPAGMAQLKEIRMALLEYKESGKPIYAYADVYSQKAYYLASVADRIFLNPVGGVNWEGLRSEVLFFKEFEEKYGVKMEVIRHGKYKSAMEPFLAEKMSDANREQITELQMDLWTAMLSDVSEERLMDSDQLSEVADKVLARTPERAVKSGLIDELAYFRAYREFLAENVLYNSYEGIELDDYLFAIGGDEAYSSDGNVAILYAQGEIVYGSGDEFTIGHELMLKSIRKIKNNSSISAVVLRVDSPGGSALSSDIILEALEDLNEDKPVVVSMGNYAASGGYYIACKGDFIFAEQETITGSIGVFGALPNISGFADDIGINAEQVSTSNSPSYSVFEPMTQEFHDLTKEGVELVYDQFLTHVAAGRKMKKSDVDAIAQGRVWTGNQALDLGLVDAIGGLDQAVEYAAELAGLEADFGRMNYPEYDNDFASSLKKMQLIKMEVLQPYLNLIEKTQLKEIQEFQKLNGIQTRLPYSIEFF